MNDTKDISSSSSSSSSFQPDKECLDSVNEADFIWKQSSFRLAAVNQENQAWFKTMIKGENDDDDDDSDGDD